MKIIIHHYGAFRKLGENTILDIPSSATVKKIRDSLIDLLGEQHRLLIEDSVLANDTDILPEEFVIDEDCSLSVLPPVCGG